MIFFKIKKPDENKKGLQIGVRAEPTQIQERVNIFH